MTTSSCLSPSPTGRAFSPTIRQAPPRDDVIDLASQVLDQGDPTSAVTDNQFIVVRPIVTPDNRPIAVLLSSKPITVIDRCETTCSARSS